MEAHILIYILIYLTSGGPGGDSQWLWHKMPRSVIGRHTQEQREMERDNRDTDRYRQRERERVGDRQRESWRQTDRHTK